MKIWIIPFPYDHHEQGEVLVKAASAPEARAKALAHPEVADSARHLGAVDKIVEWDDDVYVNTGCDC